MQLIAYMNHLISIGDLPAEIEELHKKLLDYYSVNTSIDSKMNKILILTSLFSFSYLCFISNIAKLQLCISQWYMVN